MVTLFPVSIQDGLTRLKIRPYTDQEFDTLPHVIMTSEFEWDPSVLDHEFKEDESWGNPHPIPSSSTDVGDYNIVLHYNITLIFNGKTEIQPMTS
jgi:hypothetical protein